MKKVLTFILVFVMIGVMAVPAFAANINSFSDVPSTYWGYNAIMRMAEMGILNGTTTPVNGVGTFEPEATMTVEAFIKCIVVYLNPNGSYNANDGESWSAPYIREALEKGYINSYEFSKYSLPMTREEMAMVLARVANKNGEVAEQLIDSNKIPDFASVGSYYQNYVLTSYSLGLLCGVDNNGTFAPKDTLTRAQAATVIYRLIDPSTRPEVDFGSVPTTPSNPTGPVNVRYMEAKAPTEYGVFSSLNEPPVIPYSASYDEALQTLNDYLWPMFGYVYDDYAIRYDGRCHGAMHWGAVGEAELPAYLVEENGRIVGLRVSSWVKSKTSPDNMWVNAVMYTWYMICGDKEVATELVDFTFDLVNSDWVEESNYRFSNEGTEYEDEIGRHFSLRMNNTIIHVTLDSYFFGITYCFEPIN
jgi:hypothetical protein